MSLPENRSTVYVNGISQVKAEDLNALQDCIVEGAHGTRTLQLMPNAGAAGANVDVLVDATWTGSDSLAIGVPLNVGDRILAVHAWIREPSGVPLNFKLLAVEMSGDLSGPPAEHGSEDSDGVGSGDVKRYSITGLNATMQAGFAAYVLATALAGGPELWLVEIEYDHPLAP